VRIKQLKNLINLGHEKEKDDEGQKNDESDEEEKGKKVEDKKGDR